MPRVAILAGINGSGKTTSSRAILRDALKMPLFADADAIARGLNALNPESVAMKAGRVLLDWLRELGNDRADFSFETTLSGKTYANMLESIAGHRLRRPFVLPLVGQSRNEDKPCC